MLNASQDQLSRRYLITKEIVHGLISTAMPTCDSDGTAEKDGNDNSDVKEALRILYNLAAFDRAGYYIPGETVHVSQCRERFAMWGGLLCLYQINATAKHPEIRKFCDSTITKEMKLADISLIIDSLKLHLSSSPAKPLLPTANIEIQPKIEPQPVIEEKDVSFPE